MSYEIVLKYHEAAEKGEYNKDEIKEKVIKVGKPFDETPLEDVASRIIAQLARRNILVVDVEIYEYCKKKINYQEADDGIKIKGRKFSFDGTMKLVPDTTEPDTQEQLLQLLQSNPTIVQQLLGQNETGTPKPVIKPVLPTAGPPIRFEIFDPEEVPPPGTVGSIGKGWKFTKGKKYPIFQEKPAGANPILGMLYMTTDDDGKKREISDKYFVVPTRLDERFIEDGKQYVGGAGPEPKLSFGGGGGIKDMPDLTQLRRRK